MRMRPILPGDYHPVVAQLKRRAKLPVVDDEYTLDLVEIVRGWRYREGLPPKNTIDEDLLQALHEPF